MWDKFGEMDSAEELNKKAMELKKNGKAEDLKTLAEENGIDGDMLEMFADGEIDFICDTQTAAEGKLSVELKNYQKQYVANAMEVVDALTSMMMREQIKLSVHKAGIDIDINVTGEKLAKAVRRKGRSLNTICKKVFTKAGEIHAAGTPASSMVVPMVINEYLKEEKKGKKKEDK